MTAEKIIAAVSKSFGIPTDVIAGKHRTMPVSEARFAVYYLLYRSGLTHTEICPAFGRTYKAVRHGVKRCQELMESCPVYSKCVTTAAEKLGVKL